MANYGGYLFDSSEYIETKDHMKISVYDCSIKGHIHNDPINTYTDQNIINDYFELINK